MTIRHFLCYFSSIKPAYRSGVDDDPLRTVYRRPGMHQAIGEPDELALTLEDQEFLRRLGIRTSSSEYARLVR